MTKKSDDKPVIQPEPSRRWPEGAIVYHIYPRSMQDSNGDGIGDLPGIIERLDYLQSLSVDAIWLSPFYPSPMADFGYDVADYCDVHPMFGTLDDFRRLLDECKRRNIKVIIDLVPNHSSDEHPWFQQSRASRDNPYDNWYIWRDGRKGISQKSLLPPNNWRDALTGDSAWQWEPKRQQFYLHSFDVKQPDLNWSNPHVREAIKDAMRFWLDMGVDGFRVDAVYWMAKEPLLSDDSLNPDYVEGEDPKYEALLHDNSRGWPIVYAYLSEMAEVLKEEKYQDKPRFMVTEAYPESHNPLAAYMAFYVAMDPRVAAPFNFEGVSLPWEAASWRKFLKAFHEALEQFNTHCISSYAFGNHDKPRLINRLGHAEAAYAAAVMLLTLPGMVFIYYGEEIGMHDVDIAPQLVKDPAAKDDMQLGMGRDPERTPMQWTPGKNAGFSDAETTWLPLDPDYSLHNVETQSADPASLLSLYRKLGELRNNSTALKYGRIEILDHMPSEVLGYIRHHSDDDPGTDKNNYIVLINFANHPVTCAVQVPLGKLVVSSDAQAPTTVAVEMGVGYGLRPYQAVVYELDHLLP